MSSVLIGTTVVASQGIFTESSTAQQTLGAMTRDNNGRTFVYAQAGATALVAGKLYQAKAQDATNLQDLTITNVAVGATTVVTTTTTTVAANALAGGLLTVTTATTGAGFTYRIKGNAAASAAALTIYLDEPIVVATTGTAKIDVKEPAFASLVVNPTTATSAALGAAVYNVTATYFGWLAIHGPTSVLADGAITTGTNVIASNAVAGAVEPGADAADLQASVGIALTGIADTQYGLVYLNL